MQSSLSGTGEFALAVQSSFIIPNSTRRDYENMTDPEFWEVGASGMQGPRITRRATLWRRTVAGWKVLYHQGTLVEPQP
jgi:hypothetical protein